MHNNGGGALRHLTSSGDPQDRPLAVARRAFSVLLNTRTLSFHALFPLKSSSRSLLQIQTNTSSRNLRSPNPQTCSKPKQGGKKKTKSKMPPNQDTVRITRDLHYLTQGLRIMLWQFNFLTPIYTRLKPPMTSRMVVKEMIPPMLAFYAEVMGQE